jgi:two-component system cell cycle response regulator DivK
VNTRRYWKGVPRILLVEDNEMNRDMLSRRLTRKGYEVILAQDGQEGVTTASARLPDLILMDMSLPVLNGWEATRQLKENPGTAHIPIVALTAHALNTDREKAAEAGCDAYETKPIDLPRLIQTIEELLVRRRGAA